MPLLPQFEKQRRRSEPRKKRKKEGRREGEERRGGGSAAAAWFRHRHDPGRRRGAGAGGGKDDARWSFIKPALRTSTPPLLLCLLCVASPQPRIDVAPPPSSPIHPVGRSPPLPLPSYCLCYMCTVEPTIEDPRTPIPLFCCRDPCPMRRRPTLSPPRRCACPGCCYLAHGATVRGHGTRRAPAHANLCSRSCLALPVP